MVTDYTKEFTVAAVQAEPIWFDAAATVAKTIDLVEEAAKNGADLIAFPEAWIPGYPFFLWLDSVAWQSQFTVRYAQNSLEVDGPELAAIAAAAAANHIAVAVSFSERSHGSLYLAQALIESDGTILTTRRKVKPTHAERTLFGEGDGSDLVVTDSSVGRIGSLCCWEHIQPLTKVAMFSQHEQVHVAAWPAFSLFRGAAYALGAEVNVAAAQQYAVEGQVFVVSPTTLVGTAAQESFLDSDLKRQLLELGGGYARVFGPDGRSLAEPLDPTAEGIVYAKVSLPDILAAKNAADPVGHYSRPDFLQLHFDPSSRRVVNPLNQQTGGASTARSASAAPAESQLVSDAV